MWWVVQGVSSFSCDCWCYASFHFKCIIRVFTHVSRSSFTWKETTHKIGCFGNGHTMWRFQINFHRWTLLCTWGGGPPWVEAIWYHSTLATLTHVCWIIINFWGFHFHKWYVLKFFHWILNFLSEIFFSEIFFFFENFSISESDIISVKLAQIFTIYHLGMLSKRECKSHRKIKQR
jgi:hypothetical protein